MPYLNEKEARYSIFADLLSIILKISKWQMLHFLEFPLECAGKKEYNSNAANFSPAAGLLLGPASSCL